MHLALAAPVPDDFAEGMPLEPEAPGSAYRLPLPEAVYGLSTRADLGDLRVFRLLWGWCRHGCGRRRSGRRRRLRHQRSRVGRRRREDAAVVPHDHVGKRKLALRLGHPRNDLGALGDGAERALLVHALQRLDEPRRHAREADAAHDLRADGS